MFHITIVYVSLVKKNFSFCALFDKKAVFLQCYEKNSCFVDATPCEYCRD